MILTVSLSPSLDVAYEVDGFLVGGVTRPSSVTRVAGGKALNVARVAHALGAEVRVVAALGGHTGMWIADRLRADRIALEVVEISSETRTCTAITDVAAGASTSTDIYEKPTPLSRDEWLATAAVVRSAAARAGGGYAVLAGSVPEGVPLDELREVLSRLRGSGYRMVLDSSGAALAALADAADLVKINRHEAEELLGRDVATAEDACLALRAERGLDSVVTDGIRGSAASVAGEVLLVDPPSRTGRYPVGSGDSYLAGLVSALDGGLSLAAALRNAAGVAERNAQVPGPGTLAPVRRNVVPSE